MVYKMDISAITALNNVNGTATVSPTSLTGMLAEKEKKAEGLIRHIGFSISVSG